MAHNLQSLVAASVLLAVLVLLAPANAQDKRGRDVESATAAALYWMCASGRIRSAGRTEVHLTTI